MTRSRTLDELDWPLRTARLRLRPGRSEDAVEIWPWYRLPEVQEYTTTLSPTLAEHQAWWDRTLDSCVVGILDDRIVASGKVERQNAWSQADMVEQAAGQQAEIGWVLDPAVQGRGLGTEFAAALRDIALDGLGVRRIEASCFAENHASRRVMEKIGHPLVGVYREAPHPRRGRWRAGARNARLARAPRPPVSR
jgi:RimJ/RimL family protein N-acetyltransferase